jgi:hypothetical protein
LSHCIIAGSRNPSSGLIIERKPCPLEREPPHLEGKEIFRLNENPKEKGLRLLLIVRREEVEVRSETR